MYLLLEALYREAANVAANGPKKKLIRISHSSFLQSIVLNVSKWGS